MQTDTGSSRWTPIRKLQEHHVSVCGGPVSLSSSVCRRRATKVEQQRGRCAQNNEETSRILVVSGEAQSTVRYRRYRCIKGHRLTASSAFSCTACCLGRSQQHSVLGAAAHATTEIAAVFSFSSAPSTRWTIPHLHASTGTSFTLTSGFGHPWAPASAFVGTCKEDGGVSSEKKKGRGTLPTDVIGNHVGKHEARIGVVRRFALC